MTEKTLLCPFDKNPCVMNRCAVWSEVHACCSFVMLPDLIRKKESDQEKPVRPRTDTSSSSGKYRTLLFD